MIGLHRRVPAQRGGNAVPNGLVHDHLLFELVAQDVNDVLLIAQHLDGPGGFEVQLPDLHVGFGTGVERIGLEVFQGGRIRNLRIAELASVRSVLMLVASAISTVARSDTLGLVPSGSLCNHAELPSAVVALLQATVARLGSPLIALFHWAVSPSTFFAESRQSKFENACHNCLLANTAPAGGPIHSDSECSRRSGPPVPTVQLGAVLLHLLGILLHQLRERGGIEDEATDAQKLRFEGHKNATAATITVPRSRLCFRICFFI